MNKPRTMTAEREAWQRKQTPAPVWDELDAERAAHQETQAELDAESYLNKLHDITRVQLIDRVAKAQAISRELLAALEQASFVMNHLGDQFNSMDCVAEIEEETGVPNDKIDAAFHLVRDTLAKTRGVLPENETASAPDTPAEANAK